MRRLIFMIGIVLLILTGCAKANDPYQGENVLTQEMVYPTLGDPIDLDVGNNLIAVAQGNCGFAIYYKDSGELACQKTYLDSKGTFFLLTKEVQLNESSHQLVLNDLLGGTDRIFSLDITSPQNPVKISTLTGGTVANHSIRLMPNPTNPDSTLIFFLHKADIFPFDAISYATNQSQSLIPIHSEDLNAIVSNLMITDSHFWGCANSRGIIVFDTTGVNSLSQNVHVIKEINTPGEALDCRKVGNYLFVADRQAGLQVIDVTDLNSATLLTNAAYNTDGYAQSIDVDVDHQLLVIGSGGGGIYLFSIADPTKPRLLQHLGVDQTGYVNEVVFNAHKLYIASRDNGIIRYSIK